MFDREREEDYDAETGCLNSVNALAEYENKMRQLELERIRKLYPHVLISYADYYNAAMRIIRNPESFGTFIYIYVYIYAHLQVNQSINQSINPPRMLTITTRCSSCNRVHAWCCVVPAGFKPPVTSACCGLPGPYNFDFKVRCGDEMTTLCSDPSSSVIWDGIHLTESAYRLISEDILTGGYANPSFTEACPNISNSVADFRSSSLMTIWGKLLIIFSLNMHVIKPLLLDFLFLFAVFGLQGGSSVKNNQRLSSSFHGSSTPGSYELIWSLLYFLCHRTSWSMLKISVRFPGIILPSDRM